MLIRQGGNGRYTSKFVDSQTDTASLALWRTVHCVRVTDTEKGASSDSLLDILSITFVLFMLGRRRRIASGFRI